MHARLQPLRVLRGWPGAAPLGGLRCHSTDARRAAIPPRPCAIAKAFRAVPSLGAAGYYAHCTALDDCFGELRRTLQEAGLAENTLLVFSADHGDMLGSRGAYKKQQPYDESIRVPLLL